MLPCLVSQKQSANPRVKIEECHSKSDADYNSSFEHDGVNEKDKDDYFKLINCLPTESVPGDRIDNDCDGRYDEELCHDTKDNDLDGYVDEDCYYVVTKYKYLVVFMEDFTEEPPQLYAATETCQDVIVQIPAYPYEGKMSILAEHLCDSQALDVGLRLDIRHTGSGFQYKGIVIESLYELDVFGDTVLVLPSERLGMEYYTAHYSSGYAPEQFAITPVYDNTNITVELSASLRNPIEFDGALANAEYRFSFILNRGESVQIQSCEGSLSGTKLNSNNLIAVFSGNLRTKIETPHSRSRLVEQLLPVNFWGTWYASPALPGENLTDEFILVTASKCKIEVFDENGATALVTTIVDGSQQVILPSGDRKLYFFVSENPVQILRATWSPPDEAKNVDPALLIVTPPQLWKSSYTFSLHMLSGRNGNCTYKTTLQLFVTSRNKVLINGNAVDANWNTGIFLGQEYYYANVVLHNAIEWVKISHVAPFMANLYGSAGREDYALACGFEYIKN